MLIREKLVRASLAAARAGIREVGPNNHGPWVKKFLNEVGLPEGFAWCDAFVSYELHAAAGRRLPIESASVWQTYLTARQLGWIVATPKRGDLVLYDFDGDGATDDHIGIIVRAGAFGQKFWKLNTVEGNTSSGKAGSQDDGGGVYMRTRIVRRSTVRFVRVPGQAPEPKPKKQRSPKPAGKPRRRYYTRRAEVPLKSGEFVAFQPGKGYYAKKRKSS